MVEARFGVYWTKRFDTRTNSVCLSGPCHARNDDERLRCKSSEQAGTHGYHVVRHLENRGCLNLNGLPLKPVLELTLRDSQSAMKAKVEALFVKCSSEVIV